MPRQHQNNLRGIGNKAKADYTKYRMLYKTEDVHAKSLEGQIASTTAFIERVEHGGLSNYHTHRLGRMTLELEDLEKHRESEEKARQSGNHFRAHAADYFDLALIDAHLDGVKINVEQPLEIGQKIEVHTPEKQ